MIEIETSKRMEILDITEAIEQSLRKGGIESGICLVYSLHTTTALIINEADNPLLSDVLNLLERIVPQGAGYRHDRGDGNAHAHLRTSLLGNSVVLPVDRGRLELGTWQRVLFLEFDGPRRRKIVIRSIGN